jgi:MFS family permease
MTRMIDIKAFIDDRPIAPFLWALVAMCFVIVVADGMDVAIMGFVTPSILQDWNISRPAFGFVIGAAPFGLVIGALSGWLATLVFAAGFCVSGAQGGVNAFAPSCYPTVARTTGVSWMLGIGRFGSIVGSLVGGTLLGLGWGFGTIIGILAIPVLCAAIAIASTRPTAGSFPREAAAH